MQLIGPFLNFNIKQEKVEKSVLACSNAHCVHYKKRSKDNFCPVCGEKIIEVKSEEFRAIMYDKLDKLIVESQKEALFSVCYGDMDGSIDVYVYPNRHNENGIKLDDCRNIEIDEHQKAKDIQWFLTTYKKEIRQIEELLGQKLQVKWGYSQIDF